MQCGTWVMVVCVHWHARIKQQQQAGVGRWRCSRRHPWTELMQAASAYSLTVLHPTVVIFAGDAKNANGKLRLLYECAPMSFIMEQAGGMGSTGTERVLDVEPTKVSKA